MFGLLVPEGVHDLLAMKCVEGNILKARRASLCRGVRMQGGDSYSSLIQVSVEDLVLVMGTG